MAATAPAERARHAPTPAQSMREYGRGIAGGLLFSLPVLYTMEVWWTGFTASPERLLAGLGATLALLMLYNRYAGLHRDASWREVIIDSFEELGIGLVLSLLLLWLLGQFEGGASFTEMAGKVIVEGMAAAVGVSVGTAQLGADEDDEDDADRDEDSDTREDADRDEDSDEDSDTREDADRDDQGMAGADTQTPSFPSTLALGLCGAFLVASNVAPTEEIVQIAAETRWGHLLGLALGSLALGGLVLYFSSFRGTQRPTRPGAVDVAQGVVTTYAVALFTSAFLLWFFDRFAGATLLSACALTVVLALPAALGASAGRLLLRSTS